MTNAATAPSAPTLDDIDATAAAIAPHVRVTPTHPWRSATLDRALGPGTEVSLKLELFQATGTFKARGAITNALRLQAAGPVKGITAASAGNHAIAAAWAARRIGLPAKVVMVQTANPFRVALAEAEGATVIKAENAVAAFAEVKRIAEEEGFTAIHPFDGHTVACGTGTLGREFLAQTPGLDAVIVSIGGGGLAGGLAHAIKLVSPSTQVIGVEPVGADAVSRSLAAGHLVTLDRVDTIADSLAPPMTAPVPFALLQRALDHIVTVTDDQICAGLALLQAEAKLAVEPAAGAVVAALLGPCRAMLRGQRVGLIICGANIDADTYSRHLARGAAALPTLLA